MQSTEFIKLLNCVARFINYGKHNVLAIFEWEQNHLYKQNGKQATQLKTYKNWNGIENKMVSGDGVYLEIGDNKEQIRFFDVSQTSESKFKREQSKNKDNLSKGDLIELNQNATDEILFTHKHRPLLLTALWTELTFFHKEYEKESSESEKLLILVATIYVIHSHFKTNWQNDSEIEMVMSVQTFDKPKLQGAIFSQIYQTAINLIVKIKQRFDALVANSETSDLENYYMKTRFYELCKKDKIAICRLKQGTSIDANLNIDSFEIVETLPYKPNMEIYQFYEYLQSIFNNCLTAKHLVLIRKKDKDGLTVVSSYRVDVADYLPKQEMIDFEVVTTYYPIKYRLRLVAKEYLDKPEPSKPNNPVKPKNSKKTSSGGVSKSTENAEATGNTLMSSTKPQPVITKEKPPSHKSTKNKAEIEKNTNKKKCTDVLQKVNQLKEDIKNKTY